MNAPDSSRLVGIFGAGRNGSTLLGRLLDGSPDLWIHPVDVVYLTLFDDLARRGAVTGPSLRTATTRRLRHLDAAVPAARLHELFDPHVAEIESLYLPRLASPLGTSAPVQRFEGTVGAREFLPRFLDGVRAAYGGGDAPLLAFKTSETAYVDDYARLFPALRFVHIVRHPLTNFSSLKRTWVDGKRSPFWDGGEDILRTFLDARWLPHARVLAQALEAEAERHVLVRYEDLCADPEGEIRRVSAWLGIEAPAEPARQTVLGGRHMVELPSNPSKPGVATPEHVVADMATSFAYDDPVTPREASLIALRTAPLARKLGYADVAATTGPARLWARWLPPDASERRNVTSWTRWAVEIIKRRIYLTRVLLGSRSGHGRTAA